MKAFIDRLYCFYNLGSDRPRSWSSQFANQNRVAVLAAISEQESSEDMGFTLKAMRMPLEALVEYSTALVASTEFCKPKCPISLFLIRHFGVGLGQFLADRLQLARRLGWNRFSWRCSGNHFQILCNLYKKFL